MLTITANDLDRLGAVPEAQTIIDHTPFLLTHCTADLRYRYVSPAYARMIGRQPAEIAGRAIVDIMGEQGFRTIRPHIDKVLTGQVVQYEDDIHFKDTGLRSLEVIYTPTRNSNGVVIGWVASIIDVTEQKRSTKLLADRTQELDALFDLAPVPIWVSRDPHCRDVRGNRAAAELYGVPVDENISQTLAAEGKARKVAHYREGRELSFDEFPMQIAAATGKPHHEKEIEMVFPGRDRVTLTGNAIPLMDDNGNVRAVMAALMDISELKREREESRRLAEERLILIQELNHRVKNSLAIVQAMAARTLRDNEDLRTARDLLDGRLVAFAKAHGILLKSNWQGGMIHEVLAETIPPFWAARARMNGPEVFLTSNEAIKLSMAIFELTTNAIKYGALSNESGYIAVDWSADAANGARNIEINWSEQHGPPVKQPTRKGFGWQILEGVLTQDLNAEVLLDYRPLGLCATIKIKTSHQPKPRPLSGGEVSGQAN